jgi:hypothetical protein
VDIGGPCAAAAWIEWGEKFLAPASTKIAANKPRPRSSKPRPAVAVRRVPVVAIGGLDFCVFIPARWCHDPDALSRVPRE